MAETEPGMSVSVRREILIVILQVLSLLTAGLILPVKSSCRGLGQQHLGSNKEPRMLLY